MLRSVKCPVKLPRCCNVSLVMFTSCLGYLTFTHQALSFMVFFVTIGLFVLILTSFSPLSAVNPSNCGCSKLVIFTLLYVSFWWGHIIPTLQLFIDSDICLFLDYWSTPSPLLWTAAGSGEYSWVWFFALLSGWASSKSKRVCVKVIFHNMCCYRNMVVFK